MPQIFRGKAQVANVTAAFDVILYPVQQSMKMDQAFDLEIVKDAIGDDCAWKSGNEMYDGDVAMKVVGDTLAHAEAGAAFLAPLAVVTITTCKVTAWNTTWVVVPGSSIAMNNTSVGDITFRMRRYADATQNTAFKTIPA